MNGRGRGAFIDVIWPGQGGRDPAGDSCQGSRFPICRSDLITLVFPLALAYFEVCILYSVVVGFSVEREIFAIILRSLA